MIKANHKYLITGGTGFLGQALVNELYDMVDLVVLARNEGNLIKLKERYPRIEIFPGAVDDRFEIHQAANGVSGIFHLAAFKHVGLAETASYECVSSNTIGSMYVLEEAALNKMDFVLGISTDKAAQVNGVYGATKLLMERLFAQYEKLYTETAFRIVRYGNVLGSTGSVITKWIPLMMEGKEVIITDPNATRFYWSISEAISLIFKCIANAKDSSPYCPEMKAVKMGDMLLACHKKYGVGELKIKQIGLQRGENLHEKILDNGKYSNEVDLYTVEEIMEMI